MADTVFRDEVNGKGMFKDFNVPVFLTTRIRVLSTLPARRIALSADDAGKLVAAFLSKD